MSDMRELVALPDAQKEQLAKNLLAELGVTNVKTYGDELVHPCFICPHHTDQHRNPTASLNWSKLVWNCLGPETRVKTYDGEFPISELAGGVHRILDGNGKWVEAPIKEYGKALLYRVTLTRNGAKKVVYATANHRWYLRTKGELQTGKNSNLQVVSTLDLKPKDRIPCVWSHKTMGRTFLSPLGVMRGFVFGDGSATAYGASAYFCGEKDQALLPYFSQFEATKKADGVSRIVTGLPRSWKTKLPDLDEGPSFLLGWLAGYFAADGCVSETGQLSMACSNRETLKFVITLCDRLGIGTYTLRENEREGFGKTSTIYTLTLRGRGLDPKFFLIPEHRRRFEESVERRTYDRANWWVTSVEETDRYETVYCAEVPTTQSFVLEGNILTGNCFSGTGGSILWFIATARGGTIDQARQWLAGEAGLTRAMELPALLELFDALYSPKGRPPPPPTYSERILQPWLAGGVPRYILDRGVPLETAERAGLCTAPAGALTDPQDYPNAGPRMVIPHWWKGRLIGYQSRRLVDTDGTPKYLSTPGFAKDTTVYRLHDPAYRGRAVAVEAPVSALRHTHHQPMVGLFGAEITDRQLDLLAEYQEVVFWLDPDKAGWDAVSGQTTSRGRRLPGKAEILSRRTKVSVVESPYDADPADLDDALVDRHLERPVPWPVWDRPKPGTLVCHRCSKTSHPYSKC